MPMPSAGMVRSLIQIAPRQLDDVFLVPRKCQVKDLLPRRVPQFLVEDLDLDRSVVPGRVAGLAQPAQVDRTVAHHAAAEQGVLGEWYDPVAHLIGQDPLARPLDLP